MASTQDYYDIRALSQSSLKLFSFNPQRFFLEEYLWITGVKDKTKRKDKSDAMIFGDLLDCLVLVPHEFDERFIKADVAPPSGQMLEFVKYYFEREVDITDGATELTKEEAQEIAHEAYNKVGFKRDSFAKVLERFKTEALDYYKLLRKSVGKTIVSSELVDKAEELKTVLLEDEYIGPILSAQTNEKQTVFRQMPLVQDTDIDNVKLKGLLDMVVVDHENKEIHLYDLKTCSDYFPSSFTTYRYDIQMTFYAGLLATWAEENGYIEDYELIMPVFIVADTSGNEQHTLWEMPQSLFEVAAEGGANIYGRTIKGMGQMVEDLKWHIENNKWQYPREVYENQGKRILNSQVS